MGNRKNYIALMTDFGLRDSYLGIMKGVIYSMAPHVNIIDLTNDIQPQNFKEAAFVLNNAVEFFPKETIFLCIIDPGVGTSRNSVAMKAGDYYFLSPDNGLLSYVIKKFQPEGIYSLNNSKYFLPDVSSTFHGRDIFAPVAAHIANGTDISEFGERISPISLISLPDPQCFLDSQGIWHGEVLHIDRFGNIITSLKASTLGLDYKNLTKQNLRWIVESSNIKITFLHQTFGDVNVGSFLAYIGSSGFLELGIREGNAAEASGIVVGQNVYAYEF